MEALSIMLKHLGGEVHHMIVIIFQSKTNILVPERVFNNEEERKTFIEGIHGICPLYQKSEVTNG